MRRQKLFGVGTVRALAVALAVGGGAARAQAPGNGASTVLRTFVYHEISSLTASPSHTAGESPILSASGNRAAFCTLSYAPTRVAHIDLLDAGGTGPPNEVDSYPFGGGGVTALDVSADGSTVISTHDGRTELRIARADGSGGRPLVLLKPDSGSLTAIHLSSDGSRVFFIVSGDQPQLADGTPLPAGVYEVNADGSGPPRRIVGAHEIAGLLGLPESQFPGSLFGVNVPALAVSSRAPLRLAFVTHIPPVEPGGSGEGVFAVNEDGSNLVSLTGRQAFASVAISGDGATVGYDIETLDGTGDVIGVVSANGGTPRVLARSQPAPFPTGFPALEEERLQLSFDGSWFLLSSTGVLLNTPTGDTLQLGVRGGSYSSDPAPILYDGLSAATMNDSATRFLYLAGDRNGVPQLATLDINPGSLGAAPRITNASVNPPFVLTQSRSTTTISAQVGTSGTLDRVGYSILRDGLNDTQSAFRNGGVMLDDGRNGDARAGDGLFASGSIGTDCCAVTGPRTVRIKAESRSGDGRRHATAVEIAPLAVLDQPPAPGSTIGISPSPTPAPLPPGTTGGTTTGGTTTGGTTTGGTTTGGTTTGGTTTGGTTTGGTTGGTTTGGTPSFNLTGLWQTEEFPSGLYRIRQIGSQIYWSLEDLPRVANVFQGSIDGNTNTLTGQWVDLPGGVLMNAGALTLHIESNDRMVKIQDSIPYGGAVWDRVGGGTPGGTTGSTTTGR